MFHKVQDLTRDNHIEYRCNIKSKCIIGQNS